MFDEKNHTSIPLFDTPRLLIFWDPSIIWTKNLGFFEKELRKLELVACPTAGACGGQFTANTMACVSEAIGLALPYSAGTPAPYEERDKYAKASGRKRTNTMEHRLSSQILPRRMKVLRTSLAAMKASDKIFPFFKNRFIIML